MTPEVIANHIASHLVGGQEDAVVLDPFCGCGGNAIAFARKDEVKQVICVDLDVAKLRMAYHNASIYGVQQKLLLVQANAFDVMARYDGGNLIVVEESEGSADGKKKSLDKHHALPESIDVIFLSPPWGGTEYEKSGETGFDLACIKINGDNDKQLDGESLLKCAATSLGHKSMAYFLPRNINGNAFAKSALEAGFKGPIVMEQNVLNGKLKTVTSYLGLGGE